MLEIARTLENTNGKVLQYKTEIIRREYPKYWHFLKQLWSLLFFENYKLKTRKLVRKIVNIIFIKNRRISQNLVPESCL